MEMRSNMAKPLDLQKGPLPARVFDRTQSVPASAFFAQPSQAAQGSTSSIPSSSSMGTLDVKEELRSRELRPYSSLTPDDGLVPELDTSRRTSKRHTADDEAEADAEDETTDTEDDPSLHTVETEDFPSVFADSNMSHPELFSPPRATKALPRGLGKTMSMPVGRFDLGSRSKDAQMDVDGEEGDGFDVSEWAASEDF